MLNIFSIGSLGCLWQGVKLCHFQCKPWVAITTVVLPYNCDKVYSFLKLIYISAIWCCITLNQYAAPPLPSPLNHLIFDIWYDFGMILLFAVCHPSSQCSCSWMAIKGKKHRCLKNPLTFLKWWSSLALKVFSDPADTTSSVNKFHSLHTLFPILYIPTSRLILFLKAWNYVPLSHPHPEQNTSLDPSCPNLWKSYKPRSNLPYQIPFPMSSNQKFSVFPSNHSPPVPQSSLWLSSEPFPACQCPFAGETSMPECNSPSAAQPLPCTWKHDSPCLIFKPSLNPRTPKVKIHILQWRYRNEVSVHHSDAQGGGGGGYHPPPWILVFPSEFSGNISHGYVFGVKESNGDNEKIPSSLYDLENQGQTPFCMTFHISGCKHDTKLILVSILTFSRSRIS